jgi:hypothetical protein
MIFRPSDEIAPTTMPTPPCSPPSALVRSASKLRIAVSLGKPFVRGVSAACIASAPAINKIQNRIFGSINVLMCRKKFWIQKR